MGEAVSGGGRPEFLSTLSLRRATALADPLAALSEISIHALLAESDVDLSVLTEKPKKISIHALLAESDVTPYEF